MEVLLAFAGMLIEKIPAIGVIGAKGVVVVLVASGLLEVLKLIVVLTPSKKDDEAVGKVEKIINIAIPFLKLFPHVNPTPAIQKILSLLGKIAKGIKAATEEEKK